MTAQGKEENRCEWVIQLSFRSKCMCVGCNLLGEERNETRESVILEPARTTASAHQQHMHAPLLHTVLHTDVETKQSNQHKTNMLLLYTHTNINTHMAEAAS